jgi:hypothetical protein
MSEQYLSSFYPLCCTKKGVQAINKFGFQNYIDGSCRREPDFQNKYPAITGLCRPGFSKKLNEGDLVIYLTNKKGIGENRLVAVLEVIKKCRNHSSAKKWYEDNGINEKDLPNNLMVNETKHFNLNETHQMMFWDKGCDSDNIEKWNKCYVERSQSDSDVAICKVWKDVLDLHNPKVIKLEKIFDRRTSTQNPPRLKESEWKEFLKLLNMSK